MTCLFYCVLTRRAIQYQQHFMRRFRYKLLNTAFDLAELIHQVAFIVQASGRVNQHHLTATRYGTASMEQLIGNVIKQGGERSRLEVKLFGGGRVLAGVTDVGRQNIEFAREFMQTEQLKVSAEDLGGVWPRQIQYFPRSGRVRVRRLERADRHLTDREVHYLDVIEHKPKPGDLDLF